MWLNSFIFPHFSELDLNEVHSDTCIMKHIMRIGAIIDATKENPQQSFVADYVIAITWENMGCAPVPGPLVS